MLTRLFALALTFAISVLAPGHAGAQGAQKKVILFIGNSLLHGQYQPVRSYDTAQVIDENKGIERPSPRSEGTAGPYGGIPAIFKRMTVESGLDYEVHLELISGRDLEFHYTNALDVIKQARWNTVVMHDLTTGPVPVFRGDPRNPANPDSFFKYATLLEQAIHSANPAADIFFYETWGRADLTYRPTGGYWGAAIDLMAWDLHQSYYREFADNGHFRGVTPVGDAWIRAMDEGVAVRNPNSPEFGKISLWGADGQHPSIYGAYLNAATLLYEVTGKDPRALGAREKAAADLGVEPAIAVALQRIAWEQVNAAPAETRGNARVVTAR